MEFGWINVFGAGFVILMLIPNIIYALRNKSEKNLCNNRLIIYWIVFARYLKEKNEKRAVTLAVLPACIFLMSGLLLRHWLLVGSAVLFAAGHIYVTKKNAEAVNLNERR